MLVTNRLELSPSGGRALLSRMNHDILQDLYADRLVVFQLHRSPLRGLASGLKAFGGHIDGLTKETIAEALQEIRTKNVEKIFIDGSNLGEFARAVKTRLPKVRIFTFFHNVEARFFAGAFRQSMTPHALGVLIANYLAERKSIRFSDALICLSEKDSRLLQRIYGRPSTHVSPIAVRDKFEADAPQTADGPREKFALFVGGVFYANRAGMSWFVKRVAPRIRMKTCIVGKGFENLKDELGLAGKVEVVGEVEDLAPWYRDAYVVIAPIFDGSGMKTKVAEALMFGKKVIGTPDAFAGYEGITHWAGRICTSADEFVAAIETAEDIVKSPFDRTLRAIYETTYSRAAARGRLEAIMNP
jgi:glycosyltransferase involved in cell wall biosynthesis